MTSDQYKVICRTIAYGAPAMAEELIKALNTEIQAATNWDKMRERGQVKDAAEKNENKDGK